MKSNIFEYNNRGSFLNKLNPSFKLLAFIFLSFLIAFVNNYIILLTVLGLFILSYPLNLISFKYSLRDLRQVLFYSILIVFCDLLNYLLLKKKLLGFSIGYNRLIFLLKIFVLITFCSLFLRTTSFFDIYLAIDSLERKIIKSGIGFALIFALFVSFIPNIFREYNKLSSVYDLRSNGKKPLKKILYIFPILIKNSLLRVESVYNAIKMR